MGDICIKVTVCRVGIRMPRKLVGCKVLDLPFPEPHLSAWQQSKPTAAGSEVRSGNRGLKRPSTPRFTVWLENYGSKRPKPLTNAMTHSLLTGCFEIRYHFANLKPLQYSGFHWLNVGSGFFMPWSYPATSNLPMTVEELPREPRLMTNR